MMGVLSWIVFVTLCLTGFIWVLSLLQLVSRARDMAFRVTADRRPDAPRAGRKVSVIIPARNEAGNIGPCLDAVLAQSYQDLEVIVLDDRSDDGTGDEAGARAQADERVKVVGGQERPEGWMGKVWACHTAQQQATGEVLLFIDADVRLEPEAVRQAVAYLDEQQLGALSAFGRLTLVTFWEWAVQPVIGGLILQNNNPAEVNDPSKTDKVMANGQFIMATREGYDAAGGHEAIKGEILDDVGFARQCKAQGVAYHMVYGRELYSCRMYTSLSEIWQGWTKNLFAGLHYNVGLVLGICLALFVINIVPFLALFAWAGLAVAGLAPWSDGVLIAAVVNVVLLYVSYIGGLRVADYGVAYFWTFPLGMLVTIGLFLNSARRIASGRGVTWKGRTYVTTGRGQS